MSLFKSKIRNSGSEYICSSSLKENVDTGYLHLNTIYGKLNLCQINHSPTKIPFIQNPGWNQSHLVFVTPCTKILAQIVAVAQFGCVLRRYDHAATSAFVILFFD